LIDTRPWHTKRVRPIAGCLIAHTCSNSVSSDQSIHHACMHDLPPWLPLNFHSISARKTGMGTDFTLEFNGAYIHVIHPPDYEITLKSLERLWKELAQACQKYNCRKILTESTQPKRRMDTTDAIESGFQALNAVPGVKIAICIYEYVPDRTSQFFSDVVHNRGAQIEFFNDKEKALEWLSVQDAESHTGD